MAYKDVSRPIGEIARQLDVEWIVEGAVMHSGGRVCITAHLIDGTTESQLWAARRSATHASGYSPTRRINR